MFKHNIKKISTLKEQKGEKTKEKILRKLTNTIKF